ncbi:hypothetical protein K2F43_05965 [Clostridium estertheticum]|uniref:hypothetical protein n=1 Tax=Clostridium estertheticum TaxID=238834 RepID=UPI001C6DEF2F|nr:hypothetical protein [Clostridium estertheticum]MBW9170751.1 hypothetical protein [Clostridium estertheticum]WLC74409.1 hypothetical protein KTC99_16785 [Clostridium estertheticum]
MERMMNYVLKCGAEGCATDVKIKEICVEHNTTMVKQELASYYDCLEWSSMGEEIALGMYILSDGILNIVGRYGELELIDLRITV